MDMSKSFSSVSKQKKELKKFRFREVSDANRARRKREGWTDATKEEKKTYGNKRYMGTDMSLMKKEV